MKVSIVTAVFNRAHTIADALASVQAQNYGSVEHLFQDGGSTDGTLDDCSIKTTNEVGISARPSVRRYNEAGFHCPSMAGPSG